MTEVCDLPITFSLRDIVREAAEHSSKAGPFTVAQRVLASLPEEHLRAALAECLPEYVRQQLGQMRMGQAKVAARSRVPGRAETVEGIQEYAAFLRQHVATGPGQWVYLGDATTDDLRAAREDRMKKAAQLGVWADRYDRLAKELEDSGKETVGDLPEDDVYRIWSS